MYYTLDAVFVLGLDLGCGACLDVCHPCQHDRSISVESSHWALESLQDSSSEPQTSS